MEAYRVKVLELRTDSKSALAGNSGEEIKESLINADKADLSFKQDRQMWNVVQRVQTKERSK